MSSVSLATSTPNQRRVQRGLTWRIETDLDQLESMRDQWNTLVSRQGGYGFASYDYCRIWWRHYSDARQLLVFLFHVNDELVGIVPIFHERLRLGPVRVRVAKLLASDHVYALCDPPIAPEHATQIIEIVAREVFDQHHCDALCLSPLSGTDHSSTLRAKILETISGFGLRASERSIGVHTFFALAGTFEEYLGTLKKKARDNYRREWKLLRSQFEICEEICSDGVDVIEGFEEFWRMHRTQWTDQGKLGHFGDWPRSLEFHRDLVRSQAQLGQCRLYRILADGEVISSQYAFRFDDCLHWMLPARSIGPPWDRLGLGRVGLMRMINAAIEEGVQTLEAGPGHYQYKLRVGGKECTSRSILIEAPRLRSQWRVRAFRQLARGLDKLYYRIFFSRIAPLFPWKPRPLWRSWIRSRI